MSTSIFLIMHHPIHTLMSSSQETPDEFRTSRFHLSNLLSFIHGSGACMDSDIVNGTKLRILSLETRLIDLTKKETINIGAFVNIKVSCTIVYYISVIYFCLLSIYLICFKVLFTSCSNETYFLVLGQHLFILRINYVVQHNESFHVADRLR